MAEIKLVKFTSDGEVFGKRRGYSFLSKQMADEKSRKEPEEYIQPLAGFADFYDYDRRLTSLVRDQDLAVADNRVPTYYRWVFYDGDIVGTGKIRPMMDAKLIHSGGHIRFGIDKDYRHGGLGAMTLKALLDEAHDNYGLDDIILTAWAANGPANHLIQKFGGEAYKPVVVNGTTINRYWIHL